jgi:hypothetical protein
MEPNEKQYNERLQALKDAAVELLDADNGDMVRQITDAKTKLYQAALLFAQLEREVRQ